MNWRDILNRRLARRNIEFRATKPTQVNPENLKRVVDDVYTALNKVKDTSSANVMHETMPQTGGDEGQLRVIKAGRIPDANNKSKKKIKLAVRDEASSVFEVELTEREGE
tara:strand:+ start:50620 stop:50949 length:330 start_codon:yes stop_codon:yes gene_type:complete